MPNGVASSDPNQTIGTAELLAVGAELLVGETRDTNSGDLAAELTDLGVEVTRMTQLPDDLEVVTEPGGATLRWQPPAQGKALRYDVYQGQGEKPWEVDLKPIAKEQQGTTFRDGGLRQGTVYFYQVSAVDAGGRQAARSWIVRTQPAVPLDLCVSPAGAKRIELQWSKAAADDVVGYHVERADVSAYSTDEMFQITLFA